MNQLAPVVYLKAAPEVLCKHLAMSKNDRPLLRGKSQDELITFIREQLEKREPFYTKAAYTLDVSLMDDYTKIKNSVDQVRKLLNI
jgi:shikimate kinase